MPLDYDDAKVIFADKLYADPKGKGRFDAALLAMCEYVYQAGLRDATQLWAIDAEREHAE